MKKSTQKTLTGIAIATAGSVLVKLAWNWFDVDEKVEEAKQKNKANAA